MKNEQEIPQNRCSTVDVVAAWTVCAAAVCSLLAVSILYGGDSLFDSGLAIAEQQAPQPAAGMAEQRNRESGLVDADRKHSTGKGEYRVYSVTTCRRTGPGSI